MEDQGTGHRRRAMAAVARVVAERGPRDARVADVLVEAGMSRRTFYALYANLDECVREAHDSALRCALAGVALERAPSPEAWSDRVHAALRDLLERIAAEPDRARLVLAPQAGGTPALARHERAMAEFARRLAAAHPRAGGDGPDALRFEAAVGAVHRVVQARVVEGRAADLPGMSEELGDLLCRLAA